VFGFIAGASAGCHSFGVACRIACSSALLCLCLVAAPASFGRRHLAVVRTLAAPRLRRCRRVLQLACSCCVAGVGVVCAAVCLLFLSSL